MFPRYAGALAACVTAALAAGCGSDSKDDPGAQEPKRAATTTMTAAPAAPVVAVTSPSDGQVTRSSTMEVRGTVSPPDARVTVAGEGAEVADGLFRTVVKLASGENTIDVIATAEGVAPVTTVVKVVRGRSQRDIQAAVAERQRAASRARERERAAARARAQRRKAAEKVTVPDLVGERLDIAEETVTERGLRFTEVGGGTFGIVVLSNWTVCETRPAAGAQVRKRTRVKLIVDRTC